MRLLSYLLVLAACMQGNLLLAAESPLGIIAEWKFEDVSANLARDTSGNHRDAKLMGATCVSQDDGHVLSMDGLDDYVDCGKLAPSGPLSIEAWIKPTRKGHGEASLLGESMSSYLLTYYNGDYCCFYIGGGSNGVNTPLQLGKWNHVVATFDGKQLSLWLNGKLAASRESKVSSYQSEGNFFIGVNGRPALPQFKGMLDGVRVYNRALAANEIISHFRAEAGGCDFEPAAFTRLRIKPHFYADIHQLLIASDYKLLQPFNGRGKIEVALFPKDDPAKPVLQQKIDSVSDHGAMEIPLDVSTLKPGAYVLSAKLSDNSKSWPIETADISYPPDEADLPIPTKQVATHVTQDAKANSFKFVPCKAGGFKVSVDGATYPFESRISWPNGDFNKLAADDKLPASAEEGWQVTPRAAKPNVYSYQAKGRYYSIDRTIEVRQTHVYIEDTYTNTTGDDLGLLIYNESPLATGSVKGSWVSGYERFGRRAEMTQPDYSPSAFFKTARGGVGIVPIDDVYVVQAVTYVEEQAAGVATEKFALPAGGSYTLEWAVYPTTTGDYYDFVNAFRRAEGRISTVTGSPGFVGRTEVPDPKLIDTVGMQIAIVPCISKAADDPELDLEGIEVMYYPKQMELMKRQAVDTRAKNPGLKMIFHVAHSLFTTNNPDQFADSKVINADGTQASWGDGSDFGGSKKASGWRWWIFYPTPGNSFHTALLKSADVFMDQMKMNGVFMDGFFAGYQGQWTYDGRWDQHSAEIDLKTKTIKRKIGSVLLLSQPSLIEFARKIRDKGGVVIANNCVFTRSICNEKYIIFDNECAAGPELHLAPDIVALAMPSLAAQKTVYLDMLDKLSWGELWMSYGEPFERFHQYGRPTFAAKQYPMTFEEIRPGMVRGRERIVTMNPGVYSWPGDRQLHAVFRFDDRGALKPNDALSTCDSSGVRTELELGIEESAVIEPVPLEVKSIKAVNFRLVNYSAGAIRVKFAGDAEATLYVRSGPFAVKPGASYRVTTGGRVHVITSEGDAIEFPLNMNGQAEVLIEPESFR